MKLTCFGLSAAYIGAGLALPGFVGTLFLWAAALVIVLSGLFQEAEEG